MFHNGPTLVADIAPISFAHGPKIGPRLGLGQCWPQIGPNLVTDIEPTLDLYLFLIGKQLAANVLTICNFSIGPILMQWSSVVIGLLLVREDDVDDMPASLVRFALRLERNTTTHHRGVE